MSLSSKAARGRFRKRARFSLSSHASLLSEINITPFVDVVLVLLVIFMVSVPLMKGGVSLDLPQTKAAPLAADKQEELIISLQKDGSLFFQQTSSSVPRAIKDGNELEKILEEQKQQKAKKGLAAAAIPVIIRADKHLPYQKVLDVLARIQNTGFSHLNLVSLSEDRN